MHRPARILAATLALTLTGALTACSSPDTDATAALAPTVGSTPSTTASVSPSAPSWSVENQVSEADGFWTVRYADGLAWQRPLPALPTVLIDQYGYAGTYAALQTAVTFSSTVGWNRSLMLEGTSLDMVKPAINPWLTNSAMTEFEDNVPGYQRMQQRIATDPTEFAGLLANAEKGQAKSSDVADLTAWLTVSSLISFNVPGFSPDILNVELDGVPADMDSDLLPATGLAWDLLRIGQAVDNPNHVVVQLKLNNIFLIDDTPTEVQRIVSFRLIRNATGVGAADIPWLIDAWHPLSHDPDHLRRDELATGNWRIGL